MVDRYKIDLGTLVYGWIYMSMLRNMLQISYAANQLLTRRMKNY